MKVDSSQWDRRVVGMELVCQLVKKGIRATRAGVCVCRDMATQCSSVATMVLEWVLALMKSVP